MKALAALLLCCCVLPIAANDVIMHVAPTGPTTATPIEVHYRTMCASRDHAVTREGSLITISPGPCATRLPAPAVEKVRLPELLPFGEYRVEMLLMDDRWPMHLEEDFIVRDVAPRPFEVHPSIVITYDTFVTLRIDTITCDQADCSDVSIRVDGQPAERVRRADDGAVTFNAPEHGQGFAAVSVTKAGATAVSPAAIYFVDEITRSLFEPILFPILLDADGAYGSKWRSEGVISNPTPWYLDHATKVFPIGPCITYPCGERIDPKQTIHRSGSPPYATGMLLLAPRPEARYLAFALRVRDISREAQDLGTRLPVVRELDLFHGTEIRLLDVPLDPRYRVKLRIYMVDEAFEPDPAGIVRISRGDQHVELPFRLTDGNEDDGSNRRADMPYYAEVDLPQGTVGERVNVTIEMPLDAIGWAFASVTNNETQQVTIVAP